MPVSCMLYYYIFWEMYASFLGLEMIVFTCYVVFFVYLCIAFYGHGWKP